MSQLPPIELFRSSSGARLYRIPANAFPGLIVYCYVLLDAGEPTLIDTGSGYSSSSDDLKAGLAALRDDFGEPLAATDISRIIITHGHIDHFGGLSDMLAHVGGAKIAVHELDKRVLTAYPERVTVATKLLRDYLERAGVSPDFLETLMFMYGFSKQHVRSVDVDITLTDGTEFDGIRFIHTPGHCPGQVCLLLGDILISADHVLARISPHQSPESIMPYTGLGHYLEALDKINAVDGVRLALGGHEEPITDFSGRIEAIKASHGRKLDRVLDLIRAAKQPCTISDISKAMYPDRHNYDILLALEEVGAHVEYLYERGRLAVANLEELEREHHPALRYVAL
jgi:glyoxylase-like metal-dependent hydrolase (beta-lactamase superfamily II)